MIGDLVTKHWRGWQVGFLALLLIFCWCCVVQPVSAAAPTAAFSCSPLFGLSPLSVTCTDSSMNSPTGWAWYFGDTGTATMQNPVHVYSSPGTYTVSLTTTNANVTNSTTYTGYITATAPIPSNAFVKSFSTSGGVTAININRYHYGTLSMTNPDTGAPISPTQTITYLGDSTTLDSIPAQPAIAFDGDDGSHWV
jgi:PKD repeat protein